MDNKYESFIQEEFEWIYEDADSAAILLEGFDGEITEDEFYDNFEMFMNQAVKKYCHDEYYTQMMHENMHDTLIDVLKSYLAEKED